jgi:ATP-binding cassette subfamily B protein
MQEIKLNGLESYKEKQWEELQDKLFKVNLRILNIDQKQSVGFKFINNLKNILVTFIAAHEVINGNISIGVMLSISFIIGEMNSPISQLLAFFRSWQDAKISIDRMMDIHQEADEEMLADARPKHLLHKEGYQMGEGILVKDMGFRYGESKSAWVLHKVNISIPKGKTTAIVGESGSGKTTLLKLLLKFYEPTEGEIQVENMGLENISTREWRQKCGVVMQEGFIFSESIARNIATSDEQIDREKLLNAIRVANLGEFVDGLPLGVETKIGAAGNEISGGQRQRILIARSVYKDPEYLFFDEATSSLDANNERLIMDNLNEFFRGKTVVVIAHRLSTVKNADQIIVLEKGKIVEVGCHDLLTDVKGKYFNLVKNQLELGA